ncbi:MAG: nitrogen regulation protein NR(II), partial [Gemmatimonadales bacterium]
PLLGSMELSEDLATEVAFRTREIEDQRRFMSKILDSLPHGLYVIDKDYIIQAWNQKREAGTQGVDREDALGRNVFDVLHRQPRTLLQDEFDTVFSTGGLTQMEVESTASEEPRFYRITKIPMRISDHEVTHVITIGEDMTESRRIRERVAQTEKLAAVGQLAAGVMHEINNPLATIGACIEALSVRVPELPHTSRNAFEEYMKIIDSELDRCKSIIDGLLDFSRPRARIRNPVEVNQIVEDSIFLAKHHQKFKRIKLSVDLERELPMINANAEQLIQAFLAIMINAIDAMEGSGELRVATHALNHSGEVVISFADSGPGIPREDVTKIFEPFYTTKEPGGGTGLGLSICYGIIQQHNGVLQVDSNAGRGAVFSVVLPTAASEAAEASA